MFIMTLPGLVLVQAVEPAAVTVVTPLSREKGPAGRTDRPGRSGLSTRNSLRWQFAHRPADYRLGAGEPFMVIRPEPVMLQGMENWQG